MFRSLLLVALVLLPGGTDGADVVVFGDSWATGARAAFVDMFANNGANVTVVSRAQLPPPPSGEWDLSLAAHCSAASSPCPRPLYRRTTVGWVELSPRPGRSRQTRCAML